jgi:hypothetical protein
MFTANVNEYKSGPKTHVTLAVSILATAIFYSAMCIGARQADSQGTASVTPGVESSNKSEDQQKQIAAIKSITSDAMSSTT